MINFGFFLIISHFPDSSKTTQIYPDLFSFSCQFHNCPDFSGLNLILWPVSKPSGLFADHFPNNSIQRAQVVRCKSFTIFFYFWCSLQPTRANQLLLKYIKIYWNIFGHNCISLSWILLSSILLFCIILAMLWEANTRFLGLSRETVSHASSRNFWLKKVAIRKVMGFRASAPLDHIGRSQIRSKWYFLLVIGRTKYGQVGITEKIIKNVVQTRCLLVSRTGKVESWS